MEGEGTLRLALVVCAVVAGLCAVGQGRTYYVDDDAVGAGDGSSWTEAFTNLQDALALAQSRDEIRVAQGIYRPDRGATFAPSNRDATFTLVDGVAMLGGFAGSTAVDPNARDIERYQTILSGDLNGDDGPDFANDQDNSRQGVVTSTGNDGTTVIEGFTITAGNADAGGGIRCTQSRLQIRRCRIAGNQALHGGGGMVSFAGSPMLTHCVFDNNRGGYGAGLFVEKTRLTSEETFLAAEDCSFVRNIAKMGAGLYAVDGAMSLERCTFQGNETIEVVGGRMSIESSGAGMYVRLDGPSTCANCLFTDNGAVDFGGGACVAGDRLVTFRDCTFVGNSAQEGGGLFSDSSGAVDLADCLFTANVARRLGGGVRTEGQSTLTRCAFVRNMAARGGGLDGIFFYGSPPITECVFQDNAAQEMGSDSPGIGGGGFYSDQKLVRGPSQRLAARTPTLVRCRFVGNRAIGLPGGAIYNDGTLMTLTNCIVVGNAASNGGGLFSAGIGATLTRCTLAQNRSDRIRAVSDDDCESTLDHCIVWGHDGLDVVLSSTVSVAFSDIEGGWAGKGNIDIDPLFAQPGYWGYEVDGRFVPGRDVWVEGGYHLMSQAGRWDPVAEDWVQDEVTSPCIDAGDPEGPIRDEPFPNGGIMNLGAYAGTPQASKSYFGTEPCDRHLAGDINGDCQVGLADLLIVILQWTEGEDATPVVDTGTRR